MLFGILFKTRPHYVTLADVDLTFYVDHAGLTHKPLPSSASQVLMLMFWVKHVCYHTQQE